MVKSKLFKMPLLKEAVQQISELREYVEHSEKNAEADESLYSRLGQIEGIKKLF